MKLTEGQKSVGINLSVWALVTFLIGGTLYSMYQGAKTQGAHDHIRRTAEMIQSCHMAREKASFNSTICETARIWTVIAVDRIDYLLKNGHTIDKRDWDIIDSFKEEEKI